MSPSKTKTKQRTTDLTPYPSERRHTRAFAKKNRIEVPVISLEALGAITRRGRLRKNRVHPSLLNSTHRQSKTKATETSSRSKGDLQPSSATERNSRSQQLQLQVAENIRENNSRTKTHRLLEPPRKDTTRSQLQPRPASPPHDTVGSLTDRESQGRLLVSSWLSLASDINPNELEQPERPSSRPSSLCTSEMDTPSSHNTGSTTGNGGLPSNKASTVRKATANTFMEHLEFRGITDTPYDDDYLQALKLGDKLVVQPGTLKCRQLESLLKIVYEHAERIQDSIYERGSDDGFPLYDSLREVVLDWKPDSKEHRRFPPVTARHFDWDKNQCENSSEADFQRTIMVDVIDRYDFGDKFAFSCEEVWSVEPQFLIKPSRKSSVIKQPKPDLAISFQRNAIKKPGRLDYPIELKSCLHPGSKGRLRWFPFLFLEAKRDDASLRDAFETNLLNASQSLSNIYQWMRQIPELEEKFFNGVRVMTITLNNQDLELRMHRAEKTEAGHLEFKFTMVKEIARYNRFEICHLIKSILIDFAIPYLYPVLAETYEKVGKRSYQGEEKLKRKQPVLNRQSIAEEDGAPSIRSVDHESAQEQTVPNTGNSFAMGRLGVTEPSTDAIPDPTAEKPTKRTRREKKTAPRR